MEEWNKVFITPQKFHDDIVKLAELIRPFKNNYNYIHGIPRGGSVVGIWLSHQLDIQYATDADMFELLGPNDKVLLVDDIADTGDTLKCHNEGYDIATLHYKPRSIVKPTYFVEEIPNETWIVYPFEKSDEVPNREI